LSVKATRQQGVHTKASFLSSSYTPRTMPPSTPPHIRDIRQASTISKTRFFDAFDLRDPGESIKDVVKVLQFNQPTFTFQPRTCERWLRQRRILGYTSAAHRQGKIHKRASKVTDSHLSALLQAPEKIRTQPLEVQIEFHHLPTKKRNLQVQLWKRRRSRKYKKAFTRAVSKINQKRRVEWCLKYQGISVNRLWQFVHFTDEAHVDPYQSSAKWILREEGSRYESRNMQMEYFQNPSQRLHLAASISYHHKGELQFYNDENDNLIRPRKPRKSRH